MAQALRQILKAWRSALEDTGFHLKGSSAISQLGILEHSISLQRSQRAAPGKIRINLYVSIRDSFLDPPDSILCLHGRVARNKVGFNDAESFWEEEDLINNGLEALLNYGLEWFDVFGKNAEVLAGWLEKAIDERTSVSDLIEPSRSAHPEIEALITADRHNRTHTAPVDYQLFLSLLKLEQGQTDSACRHAEAYLNSLERSGASFSNEPERTLRQLRKMGCKSVSKHN